MNRLEQRLGRLEEVAAPPVDRLVVPPCDLAGADLEAWTAGQRVALLANCRLVLIRTGVPRAGENED